MSNNQTFKAGDRVRVASPTYPVYTGVITTGRLIQYRNATCLRVKRDNTKASFESIQITHLTLVSNDQQSTHAGEHAGR